MRNRTHSQGPTYFLTRSKHGECMRDRFKEAGGLHGNFLKIDFLVVSNRREYSNTYQLLSFYYPQQELVTGTTVIGYSESQQLRRDCLPCTHRIWRTHSQVSEAVAHNLFISLQKVWSKFWSKFSA